MEQQDLIHSEGPILYSRSFSVSGRPDVVLRRGDEFVPVEHKSAWSRGKPRDWDIAQLLTYCLLVEENMGNVNSGELVYRDASFSIPWNAENRRYLASILLEMRDGADEKTIDLWKCKGCEFRSYCGRG